MMVLKCFDTPAIGSAVSEHPGPEEKGSYVYDTWVYYVKQDTHAPRIKELDKQEQDVI